MAGRMVRSCVQTALKAANSVVGLAGMAVILYALWMLRAWYREVADHHLHQRLPVPWSATASPSPLSSSSCLLADLGLRFCFRSRARALGVIKVLDLQLFLPTTSLFLISSPKPSFASRNAFAFSPNSQQTVFTILFHRTFFR
jgi:hypothetical protein